MTLYPTIMRFIPILFIVLINFPAWGADPQAIRSRAEISRSELPMPDVKQGNIPEPEITITTTGENTSVEEYRVNGQIYMIKITPAKGFPYYLIDTNGDGDLDSRRNDLQGRSVNQWILFSW